MSSKLFKLSVVAASVATTFGAQAALYNVYKENLTDESIPSYGVAIANSTVDCWGATDCTADPAQFALATETQKFAPGFSYRDESPFFIPWGWDLMEEGLDGFQDYCNLYLGYADTLCDDWAEEQYKGYSYEFIQQKYDNSIAYENGTALTFVDNTVVNNFNAAGDTIGNHRDGDTYRNIGFVGSANIALATGSDFKATHAWASLTDGPDTYIVGSVTRDAPNNDTNDATSKAAIWVNADTPVEISWDRAAIDDRVMPQGSARDIAKINGNIFAVGYNTDDEERLRASVFYKDGTTWKSKFVADFDRGDLSLDDYLNSTLYSVNDAGVAIGTYKYNFQNRTNGLFYVENVAAATPSRKDFTGEIFFSDANGKAGAINNNNDVVGQIDFERQTEIDGKPRAQRGFIAPLAGSTSLERLKNRAWYLDDLTNDGTATSDNNHFRVIDATDINDAGVISGTAYYCADGYSGTEADSTCPVTEKVVAVKLVPNEANAEIMPRGKIQTTVTREGGSFGWISLLILGVLGFRRK